MDSQEELQAKISHLTNALAEYSQKLHSSVMHCNTLAAKLNEFQKEIEVLRLYGNKICTAMADEELARRRSKKL